jgi:antitoxin Phd
MEYLSTTEARRQFAELVNRVRYGRERVVIGRRGRELAAVVSVADLRLLERYADELEARLDAEDALAVERDAGDPTLPWEQVKRDLGLAAVPRRREPERSPRARRPAPARAATRRRPTRRAR